MRWLITGATAFIGSWAATAALEAGHSVTALVRDSVKAAAVLDPRVDVVDTATGVSGALLRGFALERLHPDTRMPWTDVRDLADAIVAIAGQPAGQRVIVTVGTLPFREVGRVVDRVTAQARHRTFLPRGLVSALAGINDLSGGRLNPRLAPRASTAFVLGTSGEFDGSSGEALLGRPYRTFESTVRDAFAWWAEAGMPTPQVHAAEPGG